MLLRRVGRALGTGLRGEDDGVGEVDEFKRNEFKRNEFKSNHNWRPARNAITAKRKQNIIEHVTYEMFAYTSRGIYEQHKFMFTLRLALKIDMHATRIKHAEFRTLIKDGTSLDLN